MKAFVGNMEELTLENNYFREVLFTGPHHQLVVMSLLPGEEIGAEVHDEQDQFVRVEQGNAKATIDDKSYDLTEDMAIIVPAGAKHNIINISQTEKLKLYTLYSKPDHKDGAIHKTKAEADAAEGHEHH